LSSRPERRTPFKLFKTSRLYGWAGKDGYRSNLAGFPVRLAFPLPRPSGLPEFLMQTDTILIVEDDPIARRALQSLFVTNGYASHAVPSAEDALDALYDKDHPALVLIDIDLPGMNGLDLLTRLQHDYPDLNCTLMSANDHALTRLGYRAVPFFPKPLDLRRLLSFLHNTQAPSQASRPKLQA
jgi:DNA-binding NtrC family response regulator